MEKLELNPKISLQKLFLTVPEFTATLIFCIIVIVAVSLNPVFLSQGNIAALSTMIMYIGLLSLGETLIIIVGEIDISIGSMMNFALMFQAWLIAYHNFSWQLAAVAGICLSMALSFINSLLIVKVKMPAFIVTIAMLYACRGGARMLTFSKPIPLSGNPNAQSLFLVGTHKSIGGLEWGFIILVVLVIIMNVVLKRTAYGRQLFAVGDNQKAARLSGIKSDRVKISTFLVSGLMVGLASTFVMVSMQGGSVGVGDGWEMYVICACAVGGISLIGGAGSAISTLLGVFFVISMNNVLTMMAVSPNWQGIFLGSFIVLAVLLDTWRRGKIFGRQH